MADSSACGWNTVKNYISHPHADDSDDEKCINKVETKVRREKNENKNREAV